MVEGRESVMKSRMVCLDCVCMVHGETCPQCGKAPTEIDAGTVEVLAGVIESLIEPDVPGVGGCPIFITEGGEFNAYERIDMLADGGLERKILDLDRGMYFVFRASNSNETERLIEESPAEVETLRMLGDWWSLEYSARIHEHGNC